MGGWSCCAKTREQLNASIPIARKKGNETFKTTITLTMGVTDEMYSHKEMHPHYTHRK